MNPKTRHSKSAPVALWRTIGKGVALALPLCLFFCGSAGCRRWGAAQQPGARARIGVYDSRAVAIAYVGSAIHNRYLRDLRARRGAARAAGDAATVAKIEAEGREGQRLRHLQGFSTYPVDDVLRQIEDKLPAIKAKAGVDLLVSKWDAETLSKHEGAERIDVTASLVDAFAPSEKARRNAQMIRKHKPLPLEQAERTGEKE